MLTIFITGTDTGVGKTYFSQKLLAHCNQQGLNTIGLKPIASGCRHIDGKLYNDDALILQSTATIKLPYDIVNPYAFEPPIAPHIAAHQAGIDLSVDTLLRHIQKAQQTQADVCIIEGAGGWHVPLNNHEKISDLVKALHVPVILVVGMKLGCINHTLLTLESMQSHRIPLLGWVSNCFDPNMLCLNENIYSLANVLSYDFLGKLPLK